MGSSPSRSATLWSDDGIGKRIRLESGWGKPHARSERAHSAKTVLDKEWPEFCGSVTLKGREWPRKSLVAGNRVGLQDTPLPPNLTYWRVVRVVY